MKQITEKKTNKKKQILDMTRLRLETSKIVKTKLI